MDEDDFADIERRIGDLRTHYPNAQESLQLHRRLASYKQEPAYQERFRMALSTLTTVGFKAGRRTDKWY